MLDHLALLAQEYPLLFSAYCGLIGLLVGSFLNVVIHRLPLMLQRSWMRECQFLLSAQHDENTQAPDNHVPTAAIAPANTADADHSSSDNAALATQEDRFDLLYPRSHCPQCGTSIKAWHNIPILSYLLLGGRCAHCQTRIPARYPLIELLSGILSIIVAWKFGFHWATLAALLLTWALIALTMIDFDHQLLPDNITLPLLWLGLICNSFGLFTSLENAFWGAVAGYLSLWSIYWAFKLTTGKEGMGYGDFKLLAALGAFLGWQVLLPIMLIASISGTIVGLTLMLKSQSSQPFAFGPYLALGGWFCLIMDQRFLQLLTGQ